MAQKTKKRVLKKAISPKDKTGSFKPHHAKAYRKRHLSLAALFAFGSLLALFAIIYLALGNSNSASSARNILGQAFSKTTPQSSSSSTITSTYGFALEFDNQKFYAGALDTKSNKLYVGSELQATRTYDSIRISPNNPEPASSTSARSLTLQYYLQDPTGGTQNLGAAEQTLVAKKNPNFKLSATNLETIANQKFLVSDWRFNSEADGVLANLDASFRSYLTFFNNLPLLITVNNGLSAQTEQTLDQIARSIKLNLPLESAQATPKLNTLPPTIEQTRSKLSIFDRLTFTSQASAAELGNLSSSEKVGVLYSPAVVRIYNFFCMDITKGGQAYLTDYCQASMGSGFFVGGEGYLATNGHVVVDEPLDLVILHAINAYTQGDSSYMEDLISLSGFSEADLIGATSSEEKSNALFKALATIPKSVFQSSGATTNLLAATGLKQPDLEELATATKNHQQYSDGQDGLKRLNLIASDYRAIDGYYIGEFKSSDVALLKLEGNNYPSVNIGSIKDLAQGGDINILGFPSGASSNGLVDPKENTPTLTYGKVSAIKSAIGSPNQLIETDATIGHGNSGGPVFNSSAEVIGIATYTIDGSGQGDGVFNYIRDIADLTNLANNSSVNLNTKSIVQSEWQAGVELFYQAHYSQAIQHFNKVQDLYPEHPKAAELTKLAQARIQSGEDAKNLPWLLIALTATLIIGTFLSLSLIIRHRRKHKAYLQTLRLQAPPPSLNPQAPVPPPTIATNLPPSPSQAPQLDLPQVPPAPTA